LQFCQIIPQKLIITDSIAPVTLTGFNYAMDVVNVSFFKHSKALRLKFGLGFNTGRLKLYNENIKKQNPFFAPQLTMQFNYSIKQLVLNFGAAYFYDISNPHWQNPYVFAGKGAVLNSANQTGFRCTVGIGWLQKIYTN
jgi:hypothetical protein